MADTTTRRAAYGLVYLLVLALLIGLCVGVYRKAMPWQRTADVTLTADRAGLALDPLSDVKFQGVLVGVVKGVRAGTDGVRIDLSVEEDKLDLIPADVDAQVVPKTLFGEKFVDLVGSAHPAAGRLRAGQVLHVSSTSVEVSDLFGRLEPILRAVDPAKLSTVLSAIAELLDAHGTQITAALNDVRDLLRQVNPHLPTLVEDMRKLSTTADTYADGARHLGTILTSAADLSTHLLVPRQQTLDELLDQVSGVSRQTSTLLDRSGARYVTLTGRLKPVTKLLDEYSSGIGCTISGMRTVDTEANEVMGSRGPFVSLTIDMIADQAPYTYPDDLPTNPKSDANDHRLPEIFHSWAPHCPQFSAEVKALHNQGPYSQLLPGVALQPSYQPDDASGGSSTGGSTGSTGSTRAAASAGDVGATDAAVAEAREALARATAASLTGRTQDHVPGYAGMLLAPLVSDGEVDLP